MLLSIYKYINPYFTYAESAHTMCRLSINVCSCSNRRRNRGIERMQILLVRELVCLSTNRVCSRFTVSLDKHCDSKSTSFRDFDIFSVHRFRTKHGPEISSGHLSLLLLADNVGSGHNWKSQNCSFCSYSTGCGLRNLVISDCADFSCGNQENSVDFF